MNTNSFDTLLEELLEQIESLNTRSTTLEYNRLEKALKNIIEYVNKKEKENISIYQLPKYQLKNKNDLFSSSNKFINYSGVVIKDLKLNEINSNPNYNDFSFSLYILYELLKAMRKCVQIRQIKNHSIKEDNYYEVIYSVLNSLGIEKQVNTDEYAHAVRTLFKLFEKDINNKETIKEFKDLMDCSNILTKQIKKDHIEYCSNQIPFIEEDNQYINVIDLCNKKIQNLSFKEKQSLFKEYPQLCLGLDSNGKQKKPETIVKEYFENNISINNKTYSLEQAEREELKKIFIYMLISNITSEQYQKLCELYGKDKMKDFICEMDTLVRQKDKEYLKSAIEIKKVASEESKIIELKLYTSQSYLDNCLEIITNCITSENIKVKNR